jgi:hypothetical protein
MDPLALIRQARGWHSWGITDRGKMGGRIYIEGSKLNRHFCGSIRLRKALTPEQPVLSLMAEILGVLHDASA